MINFELVGAKNFYSIGDNGIEIRLDDAPYKLVTGTNGSGKSVIVCDALYFVLFGKSYRGVNKSGIVNTINKKACLAWTVFFIGKNRYRIERGIKPNVFDVFINGEKSLQEHSVAEQQKILEENILGFTATAFAQTVMLSTTDYQPFMQLPTPKRRELIEQLLDLGVFSDMKTNLRDRLKVVKADINDLQMEIRHGENTYRITNESIESLQRQMQRNTSGLDDEIAGHQKKIEQLRSELDKKNKDIDDKQSDKNRKQFETLNERITEIRDSIRDAERAFSDAKKEKNWLVENPNCPTCGQSIDADERESKILRLENTLVETEDTKKELEQEQAKLTKERNRLQTRIDEVSELKQDVRNLERDVDSHESSIASLEKRLNEANVDNEDDIASEKKKLDEIDQKIKSDEKRLKKLETQKDVFENCHALLGDDGIKSVVIENYIPLLNEYTNKYLDALNLPVVFSIDSEFNETVKSYFRKDLTYKNLSMGQRQRVDLALIFAWRKIAQAKNSISTNLLIFDELFDSSIDQNGTEDLKAILDMETRKSGKMNVIVISHRPETEEMFEHKIAFTLEKGFTKQVA